MKHFVVVLFFFFTACTSATDNSAANKKVEEEPKAEKPKPVMLNCTQCGRQFEKESGYMLDNRPGYFCSQSCAKDYVYENGGFTTQ